jgi:PAS domain S-box-containing protein
MIWSVSCDDFVLLDFNQSLKDFFLKYTGVKIKAGMTQEEMFTNQDLPEKWKGYYKRLLKEGPYTIEYKTTSGPLILQVSFNIIKRGEKLFAISVFGKDITERKKAEQSLIRSEATYRNLINGMDESAWVIDFDGYFLDVNNAAVETLGYSKEELRSFGIKGIDNYLSPERVKNLMIRVASGEMQVFETVHTTKDGYEIPVEISSSLITYQGKQAILAIARNITERKKQEREIESLAKFPSENSNPVFRIDQKGTILYGNLAGDSLLSAWHSRLAIVHRHT